MTDDDPGWGISWRTFLFALIPGGGIAHQRRAAEPGPDVDGLILLRQVFVSFVIALVLIGVVVVFLDRSGEAPADPPTTLAVALLAVGAVVSRLGPRLERSLDCTSNGTLAATYRMRFFLRLAFSEVAALLGFVAFFLTYAAWAYPVGAAITAVGFMHAAPTAANLSAEQQQLTAQGCGRSLVSALRHPSAD